MAWSELGIYFMGGIHGIFSVITKHWENFFEQPHPALNWIITFSFVNLTWILFRANSIKEVLMIINKIFSLEFQGINQNLINCFNLPEFNFLFSHILKINILDNYKYIFFVLFFICIMFSILALSNAYEKMQQFQVNVKNSIIVSFLLAWYIFSFSGISTFLYFNF